VVNSDVAKQTAKVPRNINIVKRLITESLIWETASLLTFRSTSEMGQLYSQFVQKVRWRGVFISARFR